MLTFLFYFCNMFADGILGDKIKSIASKTVESIVVRVFDPLILLQMAKLNYQNQLFQKGISEDGTFLPEYSPLTKKIKASKGAKYSNMTLHDTGAFYNSIVYKIDGDDILVKADDEHNLVGRYGDGILGLTDESKNVLKPEILERLKKAILNE